ncbi:MAG: hypothetical protein JWN46_1623 [Acidimicrobiales bacterium]|nr:hypothetical protein [Acidimicrobiales bacterium]
MKYARTALVLIVLAGAVLVGAEHAGHPPDHGALPRRLARHRYAFPVTAEAQVALSAAHLQDWVTYADLVAVISVRSQEDIAPEPDDARRGEGIIGRRITVRVQPLWHRPGAPSPPVDLAFPTNGWFFSGPHRQPLVFEDGRWLEVGQRYVVPLVRFREGWGALVDGAVPVVAGRALVEGASEANPLVPRLEGDALSRVAAILDRTPPDPRAAPFRHLDPITRYRRVHGVAVDR